MSASPAVSAHKDYLITCSDVIGRRRDIVVFAERGRVVMIGPPGETAVLEPLEVGRLCAALRDAIADAAKQQQGDQS